MEKIQLTCIKCPIGCNLEVEIKNGQVLSVQGNECIRGEQYAKIECVRPTRILTSILPVIDGVEEMVSVKTNAEIPKSMVTECIQSLKGKTVLAPVNIGDIIVENLCGTNVSLVATKTVLKK